MVIYRLPRASLVFIEKTSDSPVIPLFGNQIGPLHAFAMAHNQQSPLVSRVDEPRRLPSENFSSLKAFIFGKTVHKINKRS